MKKIITAISFVLTIGVNAQNIYTIAGNGAFSYTGDGGQATAASFNAPIGVAMDAVGNLYISDVSNQRIRIINTAGVISTFAGNGTQGYSGDGAQATAAELNYPIGVSLDGAGNVYIADGENGCIRKVNTTGIISTIAGNGTLGYSGDGGQATAAELSNPHAVAFDAGGNMYIVDQYNQRIRMVNTSGVISTFAGNGTAGYSGDGGQATAAEINYSSWICFDAAGNLYIADSNNESLRKVSTAGIISTVAGNGTEGYSGDGGQATAAEIANPAGVIADAAGNLYMAESQNNLIRKINTMGIISTIAGNGTPGFSGDGGNATAAELKDAAGVVLDAVGNVYIADFQNSRIRIVATPLTIIATTNTICLGNTTTITATGAASYTWSPSVGLSANTGSSVVANPTVTTTYTVSSSLYNVPTGTTMVTITVNNPTTATISPVGCSSITINATTYTATGTYTQNLTNEVGCDSVLTINATVNPLPTVTVNSATVCSGDSATLMASGTATSYTWNTSAITVSITPSPTVTTTYTVMVTDVNNCMNMAVATISVNAVPVITAQSHNITTCNGTNGLFTISSPGSNTYQWYYFYSLGTGPDEGSFGETNYNTDSMTVIITTADWGPSGTQGVYCVVTNSDNCTAMSKNDTMFINPQPTITATSSTVSLCIGSTATLTAHGANTYTWSTAATTTTIAVNPTVTTSYTVMGTSAVGCENKAVITQVVSACGAGIEQYNSNGNEVTIYPNPNNGSFVIITAENTKIILVTDVLGNELMSINPNGTSTNVNLGAQPSGIYFIKVISGNSQMVKRIIINN